MTDFYFSIGAAFSGENAFLREWIEYHKLIGVEHFFLLNNDIDKTKSNNILAPYVEQGIVTNIQNTKETYSIFYAYNHLLNYTNGKTTWLALIDLDEFIQLLHSSSIIKFMKQYDNEEIGGLGCYWAVFGSSNLVEHQKLVTESYVHRASTLAKINAKTKMILKPERIVHTACHWAEYKEEYFGVNELFEKLPSGRRRLKFKKKNIRCPVVIKNIRINHYNVKSKIDFLKKSKRRKVGFDKIRSKAYWKRYWQHYNRNDKFDDSMKKYVPQLKKNLGLE